MLEKIRTFGQLEAVNKLLTNTHLQICMCNVKIEIIWLGYHITKTDKSNIVYRAGIHKHSFNELHLCLNGSCIYKASDMCYTLAPGDLILMRGEETHCLVEKTEDFCKVALGFSIEQQSGDLADELHSSLNQHPILVSNKTTELTALFYSILQECSQQKLGYLTAVNLSLLRIILLCARLDEKQLNSPPIFSKRIDQRIAEINAFIECHLQEGFTCQDVANNVHLSLRQLNRVIHQEFGMPISDYIDKIRCECAKNLLLHTDMPTSKIAHEIGYANEFSFSKFFKRVEGMPPSQFRRSRFGGYIKSMMSD